MAYTAKELQNIPTISTGQSCDLKLDLGDKRVWLSRCGVEDGMPFENAISIEQLINGKWIETELYEG